MKNSQYGKNAWKVNAINLVVTVAAVLVILAVAVFGGSKLLTFLSENAEKSVESMAQNENNDGVTDYDGDGGADPLPVPDESVTISLVDGTPNVSASEYQSIPVIAANASSTISQQGTSNVPILLFDGRDDTSWQEGVAGYGIGEHVSFSFDKSYEVKYLAFKLGNWKSDEYYYGNAMPKTMTIILGDFTGQVTFDGTRNVEWIELSESVTADSARIIIDDIYPGTSWEDTCITEIMVYGQ